MNEIHPRGRGIEFDNHTKVEPRVEVNPEVIFTDNQSAQAQENLAVFNNNYRNGTTVDLIKCADAREITPNPNRTFADNRIACGVNFDLAANTLNNSAVPFGVVAPHWPNCGGLGAKAEIVRNGDIGTNQDPLYEFIRNGIASDDAIKSGSIIARELAIRSVDEKPVVLAPQNHLIGEMHPIAVYQRHGGNLHVTISPELHTQLSGEVESDPTTIYADEQYSIPHIEHGSLEDDIEEYFEDYRAWLDAYKAKKPNFTDSQRVQNPHAIVFQTGLADPKVFLPGVFSGPNQAFRLTVPRARLQERIDLREKDMMWAYRQAGYVFSHNVAHAEQPEKSFHSTNTMLILTHSIDQSLKFAEGITQHEMHVAELTQRHAWHSLPGRQILVGEQRQGQITRIGNIDFKVRDGRLIQFDPQLSPLSPQKPL